MKAIAKRGLFLEKNDICPTCSQTIENKDELLDQAKSEAQKTQTDINSVKIKDDEVQIKIDSVEKILNDIREKTNTINANNREIGSLNTSNSELKNYLESEVTTDLTQARNDLNRMNDDKENLFESKLKVAEQFNYNSVIAEMLRDTGIKTKTTMFHDTELSNTKSVKFIFPIYLLFIGFHSWLP